MSDQSTTQQSNRTFVLNPKLKFEDWDPPVDTSVRNYVSNLDVVQKNGGRVLVTSNESMQTVAPDCHNGFVGAIVRAYNNHYHLKLSPDSVWIAIVSALARYVNTHAEELRNVFVPHTGQKELVVVGGGSIGNANYDSLINSISDAIDKNTKDDIRNWLECNFSTSTTLTKTVSKILLMGLMKNYFSYKICLMCGLPKVTLEGKLEDWKEIRQRVDKLKTWNDKVLADWCAVLGPVIDQFVAVFEDKPVDQTFWNHIVHYEEGGSGPSFLSGWVMVFVPFTAEGKYILQPLDSINKNWQYAQVETEDIPASAVEVPVTIDDNGVEYKTIFYAGAILSQLEDEDVIKPSIDWALIDVTVNTKG